MPPETDKGKMRSAEGMQRSRDEAKAVEKKLQAASAAQGADLGNPGADFMPLGVGPSQLAADLPSRRSYKNNLATAEKEGAGGALGSGSTAQPQCPGTGLRHGGQQGFGSPNTMPSQMRRDGQAPMQGSSPSSPDLHRRMSRDGVQLHRLSPHSPGSQATAAGAASSQAAPIMASHHRLPPPGSGTPPSPSPQRNLASSTDSSPSWLPGSGAGTGAAGSSSTANRALPRSGRSGRSNGGQVMADADSCAGTGSEGDDDEELAALFWSQVEHSRGAGETRPHR